MTERFLCFFNLLKTILDSAGVFLCCLAVVLTAFIIVVLFSVFKCGYRLKNRAWFFMVCLSMTIFQFALNFFSFDSIGYALISIAIYSLLSIPVLVVRCKKLTNSARELARFIDGRIKSDCGVQNENLTEKTAVVSPIMDKINSLDVETNVGVNFQVLQDSKGRAEQKQEKRKDIDFTHVKNVLLRLDLYTLTPAEKKTALDLEKTIAFAETEGVDEQTRVKINDGLGALLKIMSKYGI